MRYRLLILLQAEDNAMRTVLSTTLKACAAIFHMLIVVDKMYPFQIAEYTNGSTRQIVSTSMWPWRPGPREDGSASREAPAIVSLILKWLSDRVCFFISIVRLKSSMLAVTQNQLLWDLQGFSSSQVQVNCNSVQHCPCGSCDEKTKGRDVAR
jgi:hypothetical protein